MSDMSDQISDIDNIDPQHAPTSRRRLFQMGAIGAAAVAGGALVDALATGQAGAANGDAVILGESNSATAVTSIAATGAEGLNVSTDTGDAIFASTTEAGAAGLQGFDDSSGGGYGLYASSVNGYGVYGLRGELPSGVSTLKAGVYGDSTSHDGVLGTSTAANGVKGITTLDTQAGVAGFFGAAKQSLPIASAGTGVFASVPAATTATTGFVGTFTYGVLGIGTVGVYGATVGTSSDAGPGVLGVGVNPVSPGLQGENSGSGPQLILTPLTTNTLPGNVQTGSFVVLKNGELNYGINGVGYHPLNSPVLLAAPVRVLDTRAGETDATVHPGHAITGGTTLKLQVTYSTAGDVPLGAKAVIGNVTAVNAVSHGYLTLWPDGVTQPGTSSINYPATTSIANGVTVALSTDGIMDIYAFTTTDVIFDATGYII
jgi:hypothetical protein